MSADPREALRELLAWLDGDDHLVVDIDALIVELTGNTPGAFTESVIRAREALRAP